MTVSLFGIRHHGPGSARSLARALAELRPDAILVEGPPEADELVALAKSADLVPPVALLAYPTRQATASASFWPFATFSPEWQAIRYAVDEGVPLRFCDLPAAIMHGLRSQAEPPDRLHGDPIAALAAAAGYDDPERWWDDVIEHRRDVASPFEAIAEAMTAVRASISATGDSLDEIREAHMRTILRATIKQGYARIAVVCGAWHLSALADPLPPASADAKTLRGLPRSPVAMTWVPWTHGRLAYAQGYGAGVASPGWYHHLFTAEDNVIERWLVEVARVLREEDLPISTAHVIEATRLAETLAVLRGRPAAGLSEVTEATRAVLCDGDELRLDLVTRKIVVGDRLGSVPAETPSVPLVADLAASQRRLKLPAEALARSIDLDLRKPVDIDRSRLLHRLGLLGIAWGRPADSTRRGKGTFWESWQLEWAPEFAVDLITAGAYGTTVLAATTAKAIESAGSAAALADVTALVERCLLADVPDALADVLAALDAKAALDVDVAHLMDSLPPLARSMRYGDVRGTDVGALGGVVAGLVTRICVGLPSALAGLDDAAAATMRTRIDATNAGLSLLNDAGDLRTVWLDAVAQVADRGELHGLIAGRICRLLRDETRLSVDEVGVRMARAVSIGTPPATATAWIEGFLSGGGLLLVHDEQLLTLIDGWLDGIAPEAFTDVLPLLRRTFSTFAPPERRTIGERARRIGSGTVRAEPAGDLDGYDVERAMRVAGVLEAILGGTA
ncbi:MAG TPA: DUF5682 family protein [Micromonosporaceae bacterium]